MTCANINLFKRLTAAALSILMVLLSMTTVLAATDQHPEAVTITVTDEQGNPIQDAKVDFTIDSLLHGDAWISDTQLTDESGCVEVLSKADFVADDLTLTASIEKEGFKTDDTTIDGAPIHTEGQDFAVQLAGDTIDDVTIEGKTVTYTGKSQQLVSVTEAEGDVVEYEAVEGSDRFWSDRDGRPVAVDAGTYKIQVTVKREGKQDLVETVTTVIHPADITGIDLEAAVGLQYNEQYQKLVMLKGSFLPGDTVIWEVNGTATGTRDIPEESAVGTYTVKLTVDRGPNYNRFEKEVSTEIGLGYLELGDLTIQANNRVYDKTAQDSLFVENQGSYDLEYRLGEDGQWEKNAIPKITDAGTYRVYVKATKTGYHDQEFPVFPINVTISKADQTSFQFKNDYEASSSSSVTLSGPVPYGQKYDFSAVDPEALAGGSITYEAEGEDGIAAIDENGVLTVDYPGTVKVTATLSGNDNYNPCVIEHTLNVRGVVSEQGQYIGFANPKVNYVLGTSDVISNQKAEKKNPWITGRITYAMQPVAGVEFDAQSGELTVSDYEVLAEEIRKNGNTLETVITATKEDTWLYGGDTASYSVVLTFEDTPSDPFALSPADGENGWYQTSAVVTPAAGYSIAQAVSGTFETETTFSDQGADTRYVYLKNNQTGGLTDRIPVDIKIDSIPVDAQNMEISYSEPNFIEKIGMLFGFYNPDVEVTFTVADELSEDDSGVQYIDWKYAKTNDATSTILAQKGGRLTAVREGDTFVAKLTLTATELEQFRGHISFVAVDFAGNQSDVVLDDKVIVIDTVSPAVSVAHEAVDQTGGVKHQVGESIYYNGDVMFTLVVKEANFFPEDVAVMVSKDGAEAAEVNNVEWSSEDEIHTGIFTISGDGDYVVTMTYRDQSKNGMVGVDGTQTEDATYTSDRITIDTVKPVVKVDYIHEGDIQKSKFTVVEHNFRPSDLTVSGTMQDINGKDIGDTAENLTAILQTAQWASEGQDTYTYEYGGYQNGIYHLTMDYQDMAGWEADSYEADEFIIDHDSPSEVTIEYAKSPLDTFLEVITLGFYNPSVTVRFTAYDNTSGIETFTWDYTKEDTASSINHPASIEDTAVKAVQDAADRSKFTATITLTATQAEQYRGYLTAFATDVFQNNSVKKVDSGNIIVVDTIAPQMTVEYTAADRKVNDTYYYNNDVTATFTVTEANFYPEDVKVSVSKDGGKETAVTPSWRDESVDVHVGTYRLTGDGDYVITVEYTDRSSNEMVKYTSATHTIDTIAPVIDVTYQNSNRIETLKDRNGNDRTYYDDTQTAVVKITEHNFNANEVNFSIVAQDVTGAALDANALSGKSAWTVDSTGDVHTITITYPGDANYTFDVDYTDLATNKAGDYAPDHFTVDKTAPDNLTVSYSTSVLDTILEAVSFGFYNAKMTVTISADDATSGLHHFNYTYQNASGVSGVNAGLLDQVIEEASIAYSQSGRTGTVAFDVPKMILGNDSQFNGTVEFTAYDRAGNETNRKDTKRIVVDNIAPTARVTYNAPANEANGVSYYDGNINATITITEANFYAGDVRVTVSKDGAAAYAVTPTWTDRSADVHIGAFSLTEDGDYIVTVDYRDKSSNQMATYISHQLTIDTDIQASTYSINGVEKGEEGGAYKNDATISFHFEDQNFNASTVKLTRTRFDSVKDVTDQFIHVSSTDKGGSGTFTIPSEVENDGIYELVVGMTDKANHTTESRMKFTINRFGSVYEYNDYLVSLIQDGGQYVKIEGDHETAITQDLVITEYNANQILEDSLEILITRDGETIDAQYTANQAEDSGGESGWYRYVYTIDQENFTQDGVYKITLNSAYAANDSHRNESSSVPQNSMDAAGNPILDTMNFTVDTKAPEIRNIVNLDQTIVNAQSLDVEYTIVDVGGLQSIEVISNGNTLDTVTDFGGDGFNYSGRFTLHESSDPQTVQLRVTDLAGNVTDTASDDFSTKNLYLFHDTIILSTNFFVRWYANQPLFWGSIGGMIVLVGVIGFLIAYKRKKKGEQPES